MNTNKTILSICNRCRDGKEEELKTRGGQRFLDNFLNKIKNNKILNLKVRSVACMSQCKRPCVISLTSESNFTYVFGDIIPDNQEFTSELFELIRRYSNSPNGFLRRGDRPQLFRSNILGRLPSIVSSSDLVTYLYKS